MLIPVVFENGQKGHVVEEMLNYLLGAGGIISFKRECGWVRPSCDPVRARASLVFSIPERRAEMNSMLTSDAPLPLDKFQ